MSNKYFYHEGPSKLFEWKEIVGDLMDCGYQYLLEDPENPAYLTSFPKDIVFRAVKNNKLNKHLYKNKIKKVHKEWLILEN